MFAAVSNGGQQGGGWFFASLNGGSGVYGAEGLIIDGLEEFENFGVALLLVRLLTRSAKKPDAVGLIHFKEF